MDPQANLDEQERILTKQARGTFGTMSRLLELRLALYNWIKNGGFEPDWSQAPKARLYYGR